MDLLPSPEQDELIASSKAFLTRNLPVTRIRELFDQDDNVDPAAWATAVDLGWFALALPEDHGGLGAGLVEEAMVFREIGRGLATGPFLSTVLAARVAAFGGRPDLAEAFAAGTRVALILSDRDGALEGQVDLVDAVGADWGVLVQPQRAALYSLADLGEVRPLRSIDEGVRLAEAQASNPAAAAEVVADVDPVYQRACVLLAAQLAGIVEATRDLSATHAINRMQFGRAIGTNQAVKHPCADMAVRAELVWAQVLFAALAIDEGRPDRELQSLSAFVVAADAGYVNGVATVQVHGGMGFTFEHDSNLYAKRAQVLGQLLGDRGEMMSRLVHLPTPV